MAWGTIDAILPSGSLAAEVRGGSSVSVQGSATRLVSFDRSDPASWPCDFSWTVALPYDPEPWSFQRLRGQIAQQQGVFWLQAQELAESPAALDRQIAALRQEGANTAASLLGQLAEASAQSQAALDSARLNAARQQVQAEEADARELRQLAADLADARTQTRLSAGESRQQGEEALKEYRAEVGAENQRLASLGQSEQTIGQALLAGKVIDSQRELRRLEVQAGDRQMYWMLLQAQQEVQDIRSLVGGLTMLDPTGLSGALVSGYEMWRSGRVDWTSVLVSTVPVLGRASRLLPAGSAVGRMLCTSSRLVIAAGAGAAAWQAYEEGNWLGLGLVLGTGLLKYYRNGCFVAGTQVVVGVDETGAYLTRSIEAIEAGDWVLSQGSRNGVCAK